MSTEAQFTGNSQHDAKLHVIRWLGENVFPQLIAAAVHRFGEDAIVDCINEGLIVRSQSKIGVDPTMMRKVKNGMELSDAGWELYRKLNGEAIV